MNAVKTTNKVVMDTFFQSLYTELLSESSFECNN